MKSLLERFTKWFNRTHNRSGTLWEDRYKSVIVEDGVAARTMAASIDLNPVVEGCFADLPTVDGDCVGEKEWSCGSEIAWRGDEEHGGNGGVGTSTKSEKQPRPHAHNKCRGRDICCGSVLGSR